MANNWDFRLALVASSFCFANSADFRMFVKGKRLAFVIATDEVLDP